VAALFLEDCTVQSLLDARYAILFGGIISVGASYTCQALGQKDADPNFAALIYCLDPVFAALGGALILHEVLPSRGYIGCALILCGILLSRIPGLIKKEEV
jgi:drug/metabolite transporter (DMT)-like permease